MMTTPKATAIVMMLCGALAVAGPTTKPDVTKPPPIGTKQADVVKLWDGKRINQTASYKLPNGAVVQIEQGKVSGGYWQPFIGMSEADLLTFNYAQRSTAKDHTLYVLTDEGETKRWYQYVDRVLVKQDDAGEWKVAVVSKRSFKMRLPR